MSAQWETDQAQGAWTGWKVYCPWEKSMVVPYGWTYEEQVSTGE